MKAQQRHQLKQNDFAATVARMSTTVREQRDRIVIVFVIAAIAISASAGYYLWRKHTRDQAGSLFAAAMAVNESQIAPAPTVPGATQAAGTFATLKARQEAALQAFQQVANAYPSTPDGLAAAYQAAGALFGLGRLTDAEKAYQEVIARAGSSIYGSAARMGLAETLASQAQYDRAIKEYADLAAQRDGMMPVDGVLVQLARTYAKAGKTSEARATFKRVVDEFPNSNYAAEARQQIALLG
jgi:TolA-binding protein